MSFTSMVDHSKPGTRGKGVVTSLISSGLLIGPSGSRSGFGSLSFTGTIQHSTPRPQVHIHPSGTGCVRQNLCAVTSSTTFDAVASVYTLSAIFLAFTLDFLRTELMLA
ncbi:hypothetical protein MRB53_037575 [Persea americana]|nr:hypothetical protein MRB53_037575 [Persea americana]